MPAREPLRTKILIVDDEAFVLQVVGDAMRDAGYEVGVAADGVEGLRIFQQESWDVVIADRGMPDMDGEEMTEAIKAISPDVPVILMTGLPTAVKCPGLFEAVLRKPFLKMDILALVAEALQRRPPQNPERG